MIFIFIKFGNCWLRWLTGILLNSTNLWFSLFLSWSFLVLCPFCWVNVRVSLYFAINSAFQTTPWQMKLWEMLNSKMTHCVHACECYYGRASRLHTDCYLCFNARISAICGTNCSLTSRKKHQRNGLTTRDLWPWHRPPWAAVSAYFQSHNSGLQKSAREIPIVHELGVASIETITFFIFKLKKKQTTTTWNPNIVSRQEETYHLATLHIQLHSW